MPLSPNIPTSFVPKQQVVQAPRQRSSGESLWIFVSVIALVIIFLAAGGVFGYELYLKGVAADKSAEVKAVQKTISTSSVEEYVRSRDRFIEANNIIDKHIAVSQFLSLLEKLTLQNVYFDSMKLSLNADHSAKVALTGTARNFNALAAQSSAFSHAQDRPLVGTVFSDITTSKSGFVSFSVTSSLASEVLIMKKPDTITPQQTTPVVTGSTTPATTSSATTSATTTKPTKP